MLYKPLIPQITNKTINNKVFIS